MNDTILVFIILHYKNIKDTLECIESIRNLNLSNSKIVVVENGSNDSSTEELNQLNSTIDIIINDENYGFAKGNNIGISFAKEKYKPKYYVVINNDIIINDSNILDEITKTYYEYNFDVLGSKIIAKNGINQNPNFLVLTTLQSISRHLLHLHLISFLNMVGLYEYFRKLKRSKISKGEPESIDVFLEGVPLHGSALIFSEKYINKYQMPFHEDTFLYGEEEFLYYRKIRDNLKFIYSPNITVYHKEDASLNNIYNNNKQKLEFIVKHSKKSLLKLIFLIISNKMGGRKNE